MRFTRFQAMALVAILHVLVPAALIAWQFGLPFGSVFDWAARTLALVTYVLFIYLAGSWVFASYYVRYAMVLAAAAAVVQSLFRLAALPFTAAGALLSSWIPGTVLVIASAALLVLSANAVRARSFGQPPVALSFPLAGGVYAVFEGGNGQRSRLMNYHYRSAAHGSSGVNASMRHAVDITRLSAWGNDADGVFPSSCGRYPVFNEPVLSPCEAVVAEVKDGQQNEVPWSGRGPYNLGNYVLLRSGNVHVLLGHLQPGSIRVSAGSVVHPGDPIAAVGNSGWTSQPHLHVQAMRVGTGSFWSGEGIPVAFDGRAPYKNRLFLR